MSTLWIAIGITLLIYAIPQAFRTWRKEMEDDNKVVLAIMLFGILAGGLIMRALSL
jgi:hypothetical protein